MKEKTTSNTIMITDQ